jgi:hypothetical protein
MQFIPATTTQKKEDANKSPRRKSETNKNERKNKATPGKVDG